MSRTVQDLVGDWAGRVVRRFNWRRFCFEWGRWHYKTDCTGRVLRRWFVVNVEADAFVGREG